LLFINKTVSGKFSGGASMAAVEKDPMPIAKGNFKSLAHEIEALALPDAHIFRLKNSLFSLRSAAL